MLNMLVSLIAFKLTILTMENDNIDRRSMKFCQNIKPNFFNAFHLIHDIRAILIEKDGAKQTRNAGWK